MHLEPFTKWLNFLFYLEMGPAVPRGPLGPYPCTRPGIPDWLKLFLRSLEEVSALFWGMGLGVGGGGQLMSLNRLKLKFMFENFTSAP